MARKKLKASWVKTDIPKHIKAKLWIVMKDNPTHTSWQQSIANLQLDEVDDKYVKTTIETYKRLKQELQEMPLEEVETLPEQLKKWIYSIRPELLLEQQEILPPHTVQKINYKETPHKRRMRELAKELAKQISFQPHLSQDILNKLPVEFKRGRYRLSFGTVEIGEKKHIKVNIEGFTFNAEPYLENSLYEHLLSSEILKFAELAGDKGKLQYWLEKTRQYYQWLIEFLKVVTDEVQRLGVNVNFHGEKPGLTESFIITTWNETIKNPGGYIGNPFFCPPEALHPSFWHLNWGFYVIAESKSEEDLKAYAKLYKKLRSKCAKNPLPQNISTLAKEMITITPELRQRLLEFSDMEQLPGHCELC